MDGNHFDDLARSLLSRRGAVWTLLGIGAGAGLAGGAEAARKKKRGGGSRFGCAKHDNSCSVKSGGDVQCPDAPQDSNTYYCLKNNKGKTVCATASCAKCKRNADCVVEFGSTAQCIKKCPVCQRNQGVKSACIVPLTAAPTG